MDPATPINEELIFQIAADLAKGERAAYLDAALTGRPEVRARIEGLLASVDFTGYMEATPTPASPELEAQLARLKPEKPGERIGPTSFCNRSAKEDSALCGWPNKWSP